MYCLCEILGRSLLWVSVYMETVERHFLLMVHSELRMSPCSHTTHVREKVCKEAKAVYLSLPACKGGFLLRVPAIADAAGYSVAVSKHLCSVIILACCHSFTDRGGWHHTCTWDVGNGIPHETLEVLIYLLEFSSCWISKDCCKQWKLGNVKLKVKIRVFLPDEKHLANMVPALKYIDMNIGRFGYRRFF